MVIGTHGRITYEKVNPKLVRARARYRDRDGQTKFIRGQGTTEAAARRHLQERLAEKMGAMLTGQDKLGKVIDAWLVEIDEDTEMATSTRRVYRGCAEGHIRPALGELYLSEVDVQAVNHCLRKVRDSSGPSAAKTARSVLSGVLSVAVKTGALQANPAREAITMRAGRKSSGGPRALTVAEVEELTDALRSNERAVNWDLPDLVEWMLYTGCRIGEALALRYGTNSDGKPLLDLEHGTWEVNATVIRVMGVKRLKALEAKDSLTWEEAEELKALRKYPPGLHVQERTKSDAGWRILALPPGAVEMLHRRASEVRLRAPGGIVFGAPLARSLRDPSNTDADLRDILDPIDCEECNGTGYQLNPDGTFVLNGRNRRVRCREGRWSWVKSHTFRKTVATRLDEAGLSARAIADQLGHAKPSMTQDVYLGRNVVNAAAAKLLDR
jgi:integrase